mmetsp:Transcript_38497/g.46488  ORF Transcript_38497/g.46488 Transcript_38497/m.46488 type:complete len:280 (+) Transcript_38497:212-1051(+)|eukprot:CAMPEP_0197849476 /NCGR_PEP_ID=MMETSP1438-20131217/12247_1 /TAXON_ID=1461541 /ORGANISM="Pterosperma sp., Strain CCMP1384" /LENGTH=279 /DNA_ID=CAMNT_0043462185 /DNA_START=209 /DNA_END=1048 /DNA_ORIENTATION=+
MAVRSVWVLGVCLSLLSCVVLSTAQYPGASFEADTGTQYADKKTGTSSIRQPTGASRTMSRKGLRGRAEQEEFVEDVPLEMPIAEDDGDEEDEAVEIPDTEQESGSSDVEVEDMPPGMPAVCGTEPHSDVGGYAVKFGIGHRRKDPADCCLACQEHAEEEKQRGGAKPCNSWVFCPEPVCWGLDTGWNHTYGECWLKFQDDVENPIYGQRGAYTEEFIKKFNHIRGGPPAKVPWIGGVMGQTVDHSKQWMTGPKGIVAATGEKMRVWRAWLNDFEPEKK